MFFFLLFVFLLIFLVFFVMIVESLGVKVLVKFWKCNEKLLFWILKWYIIGMGCVREEVKLGELIKIGFSEMNRVRVGYEDII